MKIGITKGINIVFLTVLALVCGALFLGGLTFYQDATFLYQVCSKWQLALLCAVAVWACSMLIYLLDLCFSKTTPKQQIWLYVLGGCALVALQLYFLLHISTTYVYDTSYVISAAAALLDGVEIPERALYYISVYPNQNAYICLTSALLSLARLCGVTEAYYPMFLGGAQTLFLDVALCLAVLYVRRFLKKMPVHRLLTFFYVLLLNPFFYLSVSYYYTVILSLPGTMLGLYLLLLAEEKESQRQEEASSKQLMDLCEATGEVKVAADEVGMEHLVELCDVDGKVETHEEIKAVEDTADRKQLIYLALAGIVFGASFALRATAIIFIIAWCMVEIGCLSSTLWSHRNKIKSILAKGLSRLGVFLIAVVMSIAIIGAGCKAYIGIDTTDTAFPTLHWVMMSLSDPGCYNGEDEAYTASFATAEEKQEAVMARLMEKIDAMSLGEYISLVKTKVQNTFGNGQNGQTTFYTKAQRYDGLYEVTLGGHKDALILWEQGYHLWMLLGIIGLTVAVIFAWISPERGAQDIQTGQESAVRSSVDAAADTAADATADTPAITTGNTAVNASYDTPAMEVSTACVLLLSMMGAMAFYILWEAQESYSIPFVLLMTIMGFAGWEYGREAYSKACHAKATRDKTGRNKKRWTCCCKINVHLPSLLCLACAGIIAIWAVAKAPYFTKQIYPFTYTAASQTLARGVVVVDDGQLLSQTFVATAPFDTITMQWRNTALEESTAVYQVSLVKYVSQDSIGEKSSSTAAVDVKVLYETTIEAAGTTYDNVSTLTVPAQDDIGATYGIWIEKIHGDLEDDLQWRVYGMVGFVPYMLGDLTLDGGVLEGSLLFAATETVEESYTTLAVWGIFHSILIVAFLVATVVSYRTHVSRHEKKKA